MPAPRLSAALAITLGALANGLTLGAADVKAVPPQFFEEEPFEGVDLLRAAPSRPDARVQRPPLVALQQEAEAQKRVVSPGCREFLGGWAARGVVDLALVCREAYTDAECKEAEKGFGGEWPTSMRSDELAESACQAIERRDAIAVSFSFLQHSRKTHGRGADFPHWVRVAPVIKEDPERSEWPAPVSERPATWEGPALTPEAMQQLATPTQSTAAEVRVPEQMPNADGAVSELDDGDFKEDVE